MNIDCNKPELLAPAVVGPAAGVPEVAAGVPAATTPVPASSTEPLAPTTAAAPATTAAPAKPELLAPAGNQEALLAALSAGADAIYLGVEDFNARRNAPNFTLEGLPEVCDLVHLAGRRLYLTLNTMVLPHEMNQAQDIAYQAFKAGVDALIVQDLGLIGRLATLMPQLELHASTQMNLHSAAAVRQAVQLGISRVTLSRELSLQQIAQIAQEGVPLEVFAHGALCVCYSGQCLFSSLVGQRSANRGLCAQACRLPYQLIDTSTGKRAKTTGDHLLSPADLATIDILPQLVASGVASLKIEGRMKSAPYVATVTRLYRQALDALFYDDKDQPPAAAAAPVPQGSPPIVSSPDPGNILSRHPGLDPESSVDQPEPNPALPVAHSDQSPIDPLPQKSALDELAETFSRGFTTAYLQGNRGNSMMSYARPNNQGVAVGRVAALDKGLVAVGLTKRVTKGDVLEFRTSRGRSTVTLVDFWDAPDTNRPPLEEAPADSRIWLKVPNPVSPADRVFRVRNAELMDEAASHYGNTLFQGNNGLVPIHAHVIAHLGHPLQLTFTATTQTHPAGSPAPAPAATSAPAGSPAPAAATSPAPRHSQGTATSEPLQPARTKALTPEDIREHVGRVGGTPFTITSWDIQLDTGVGLGFSALHKLRAQALEDLTENLLEPWRQRRITKQENPPALAPARRGKPRIAAIVCNAAGARAAIQGGAELLYLHTLDFEATAQRSDSAQPGADAASTSAASKATAATTSTPKLPTKVPIVHLLPAITHDQDLPPLLESLQRQKKTSLSAVANNLAEVYLLKDQMDSLEAGPSLGICNKEALDLLARLGLSQAWLSPELSYQDITPWATTATLPLALTIVGKQEVMITQHCILMAQGPCDERCDVCARRKAPRLLEDRKGYLFPVRTDGTGRSHLFNSVALDLVPSMPELISLGISTLVVDGTLMTTKELQTEVARATRARDIALKGSGSLPKREAQTTGHFFRGVY